MKAIILAAGRGRRLPKNLSKKPKVLLKIGNQTILEKQIKNFKAVGIKDIALVTGYNSKSLSKFKNKKFHNEKWSKTNMVYSLLKAHSWLKKYNCLISYGDIFYEKKALIKLKKSTNPISLLYDKNWIRLWKKRFKNPLNDAETFKISKNKITEIGQKTKNLNAIKGQYMGLIKITPKGWINFRMCLKKNFKDDFKKIYLTDVFHQLIQNKISIFGISYSGKWAEVDSKKDYEIMINTFKK